MLGECMHAGGAIELNPTVSRRLMASSCTCCTTIWRTVSGKALHSRLMPCRVATLSLVYVWCGIPAKLATDAGNAELSMYGSLRLAALLTDPLTPQLNNSQMHAGPQHACSGLQ